ncbi:MAG: SpoIID/LytB domain-containing protein [Candidatus Marinimicrobia bacterium]|nr:SpoIID/LytB domain-containing protein [Candidatus Neomarinimicrobiota bacterium]
MKKFALLWVAVSQLLFSQKLFDHEPEVRVRIINTLDELTITFDHQWTMEYADGRNSFRPQSGEVIFNIEDHKIVVTTEKNKIIVPGPKLWLKSNKKKGTLNIKDVPYGVGWWWEGKETRNYEGEISIYINENQQFDVVVKLMMEDYLKQVVPYEIGGNSPLASLKAQAVAARSEAVIALTSKLYSGEHYDLTSDVECQVFSGNNRRTASSDRAVDETRSIILTEKGQPINAYYASNCGGHSELIENVWPDRPRPGSYQVAYQDNDTDTILDLSQEDQVKQWIASSPEVFCNPDRGVELPDWSQNNFRWTRENTLDELSKTAAGGQELGQLLDIKILKRGPSGRIQKAEFIFEKGPIMKETELAIRMMWSPSLRSSCFVIEKTTDKFILKGAGWGHGVGMCQSGAVAMANMGRDYQTILGHYYRKADLTSIY